MRCLPLTARAIPNPLDDATLSDKFMELAAPVIGSGTAEGLLAALWQLDTGSVRGLRLAGLGAA